MHEALDPDPRRALLDRLDAEAERGGGEDRIRKQHESGKLTARERIGAFFDPGSFVELDKFKTHRCTDFGMQEQKVYGDGVVTGYGLVDGRRVFAYAQDFTVFGGSLSAAMAEKICKVMDRAMTVGCPIVGLHDSGGARIQEGVAALAGYADIFLRNTRASGMVPQISVILGPYAGAAGFGAAITDFIFMVKDTSHMFIASPEVIRAATGEEVSREALGGAETHSSRSGVAHFAMDTEEGTFQAIRELLAFLPSSPTEPPPARACADDANRCDDVLRGIVPADPAAPYERREIIRAVADGRHFFEVHERCAPNLVVGFARLGGRPVGIVANQPAALGGALDADASVKGGRFVRFCDAFGIPLLTFVDVPGFVPAPGPEWGGVLRHGAKLLYAYAESTVPKVTVITRKAYGGAYALMASKHLRAAVNLAWTTAEIAVMAPDGAVNIVFRKELQAAADPTAERARLIQDYRDRYANPYTAAELGYVDSILQPEQTRPRVFRAFEMLRTKRLERPPRKHGNIP